MSSTIGPHDEAITISDGSITITPVNGIDWTEETVGVIKRLASPSQTKAPTSIVVNGGAEAPIGADSTVFELEVTYAGTKGGASETRKLYLWTDGSKTNQKLNARDPRDADVHFPNHFTKQLIGTKGYYSNPDLVAPKISAARWRVGGSACAWNDLPLGTCAMKSVSVRCQ